MWLFCVFVWLVKEFLPLSIPRTPPKFHILFLNFGYLIKMTILIHFGLFWTSFDLFWHSESPQTSLKTRQNPLFKSKILFYGQNGHFGGQNPLFWAKNDNFWSKITIFGQKFIFSRLSLSPQSPASISTIFVVAHIWIKMVFFLPLMWLKRYFFSRARPFLRKKIVLPYFSL